VARNFRTLLADSRIMDSHAACGKVQDPYSLRCIPQVHGASRDALEHFAEITLREINSVTDNPLVFEGGETVSGGNFHGQPLALTLDYAAIALAELGSISERRTYLLLSGKDELPVFLLKDTGVNSGFMMIQYTQAALVSENKGLAHPASVDSISTSLGQEDHVSMGATAATKCWRILDNVEHILASELLCAAQALDFRAPLKPGVGPRTAHEELRKMLTHAEKDRDFGRDVVTCRNAIRCQRLTDALIGNEIRID
jgi:histidine ammonia-lyase